MNHFLVNYTQKGFYSKCYFQGFNHQKNQIAYYWPITAFFLKIFCCRNRFVVVKTDKNQIIYLNRAGLEEWLISQGAVVKENDFNQAIVNTVRENAVRIILATYRKHKTVPSVSTSSISNPKKDDFNMECSTKEERQRLAQLEKEGNEDKIIEYFDELKEKGKAVDKINYWADEEGRLGVKALFAFNRFKAHEKFKEEQQKPQTYATKAESKRLIKLEQDIKKCERDLKKAITEDQKNNLQNEKEKLEKDFFDYLINLTKLKGARVGLGAFWVSENGSMPSLIPSALSRFERLIAHHQDQEILKGAAQRFSDLSRELMD